MTTITQHINADKAGMIEYLRERADNVDNNIADNAGLTKREIARRAGYREGIEFAVRAIEAWDNLAIVIDDGMGEEQS